MIIYRILVLIAMMQWTTLGTTAEPYLTIEGKEGLGKGQHIVFVTGEEYYRSEEGMSMFAKILSQHHGFKCTVLFAIDPKSGTINANQANNIPGLALLQDADLMVIFARFRELPDSDMRYIVDYVNAGKPVLGIRNATHAFHYAPANPSPYKNWDFKDTLAVRTASPYVDAGKDALLRFACRLSTMQRLPRRFGLSRKATSGVCPLLHRSKCH